MELRLRLSTCIGQLYSAHKWLFYFSIGWFVNWVRKKILHQDDIMNFVKILNLHSFHRSIMMAHNLCYTTLLKGGSVNQHNLNDTDYIRTPSGNLFVKSTVRKGNLFKFDSFWSVLIHFDLLWSIMIHFNLVFHLQNRSPSRDPWRDSQRSKKG